MYNHEKINFLNKRIFKKLFLKYLEKLKYKEVYIKMKSRLWCFTNFNRELDYKSIFDNEINNIKYIAYGEEICPETNKAHHQGWIYFKNDKSSIKNVAKMLGKCHVALCRGSIQEQETYCSKEKGYYTEFGSRPDNQGARTDLDEVRSELLKGLISVDDIAITKPNLFHQYGRTLTKIEDIAFRRKWRTEMTEGVWYWGETGCGKSDKAFENYNPMTHYKFTEDWWDGYTGQETVIIDEFRGDILKFRDLLSLVDKHPHYVKRRCREPIPFLAKKLIVTSSLHPKDIYTNLNANDKLDQLFRRFKIVKMAQKCLEGNTEPLDSDDELL